MITDKEVEEKLFDLLRECKKAQYGLPHTIENNLRNLEKALDKCTDVQKSWLKQEYISQITNVKDTLNNKKLIILVPAMRSLYDKIFKNHLNFDKHIPNHATRLFKKFIKGITYFRNQKEKTVPIYHRFYSCGPYQDTHRTGNLICTKGLNKKEKRRRQDLITRCYLERLIYNEIYVHETLHFPLSGVQENQQDEGHLFRLDLTKQDFATCFPHTAYEVTIEWSDGMPYKLIIVCTKSGRIETHTYIKTPGALYTYDADVTCIKEINNKKYFKISTFDTQGKFKPV